MSIILKNFRTHLNRLWIVIIQLIISTICLILVLSLQYKLHSVERNLKGYGEYNHTGVISLLSKATFIPKEGSTALDAADDKMFQRIYKDFTRSDYFKKVGISIIEGNDLSKFQDESGKPKPIKSINNLYVDYGMIKFSNMKLIKGRGLTENDFNSNNLKNIPIVISEDLESFMPINSTVIEKEKISDSWTDVSFKVVGVIKKDSDIFNMNQDYKNYKMNNTVIIPIFNENILSKISRIQLYGSVYAEFKDNKNIQSLSDNLMGVTNDYDKIWVQFTTINKYIEDIYNVPETKNLMIVLTPIIAITVVLSAIGFIGVIMSYINLRRNEFGISYALGLTKFDLQKQILGENITTYITATIMSFFIYVIASLTKLRVYLQPLQLYPALQTIIFSLVLAVITSIIPLVSLNKSSIVDLLKEENR